MEGLPQSGVASAWVSMPLPLGHAGASDPLRGVRRFVNTPAHAGATCYPQTAGDVLR
jgi:hypothetical protein